jgi:hypothetical protein
MTNLEFFDGHGKFVMPSAEAIAALDDDAREKFRAVQEAATENENDKRNLEAELEALSDAHDEREAAHAAVRQRTQTDNAKEYIESERLTHG